MGQAGSRCRHPGPKTFRCNACAAGAGPPLLDSAVLASSAGGRGAISLKIARPRAQQNRCATGKPAYCASDLFRPQISLPCFQAGVAERVGADDSRQAERLDRPQAEDQIAGSIKRLPGRTSIVIESNRLSATQRWSAGTNPAANHDAAVRKHVAVGPRRQNQKPADHRNCPQQLRRRSVQSTGRRPAESMPGRSDGRRSAAGRPARSHTAAPKIVPGPWPPNWAKRS